MASTTHELVVLLLIAIFTNLCDEVIFRVVCSVDGAVTDHVKSLNTTGIVGDNATHCGGFSKYLDFS